jgi:23S rRNA (pseudouridine1915-N3)-methyltransferase
MKIRILWVGKTKEPFVREGMEKYLSRLRPFVEVAIVQIKETKEKGGRGVDRGVEEEGQRIMRQSASYILLDEKGRELTSQGLASLLEGRAEVDFVLGGPYGVSEAVRGRAAETIALSRMTLTHEMARLLLLEQLYRAMTILGGGRYHH